MTSWGKLKDAKHFREERCQLSLDLDESPIYEISSVVLS